MKKMLIFIVIFIVAFSGFVFIKDIGNNKNQSNNKIMTLGLSGSKEAIFRGQLGRAERNVKIVENGRKMLDEGKSQEAIGYFKNAIIEIDDASIRTLAVNGLIDAYEMNREYEKAANRLEEKIRMFVVPETDMFRIPTDERLKYLQYATQGDYELAIKHATNAYEADLKLPNRSKDGNTRYLQRLNDLKASKEYIEGLKK